MVDERIQQRFCAWVGASHHECAGCEYSGACDEEDESWDAR
jgi:hypothetical protein